MNFPFIACVMRAMVDGLSLKQTAGKWIFVIYLRYDFNNSCRIFKKKIKRDSSVFRINAIKY